MNFQFFTIKKLKINLMLKNSNAIIIVAGEPKSVFLELFFKTLKKIKNIPLILIANKKLLIDQAKLLKKKISIKTLNGNKKLNYRDLNNKNINLVDIPFNYKTLDGIDIKNSNIYIMKCFEKADQILKQNKNFKLINGPVIKKNLLKKKILRYY